MNFIKLDSEKQWQLSTVTKKGRELIKVPIAFIWKGNHPEYGEVNINQSKIDSMLSNYKQAVAGYDPSLKIGHATGQGDRFGDEPSSGWPESLYQEGDTLYGEFAPTDEKLLDDIKSKKFRYASAEILDNAIDKTTGEEVGSTLVGVALTNQPYLPMRHREVEVIEKFGDCSDKPVLLFSFNLSTTELDPMTIEETKEPVVAQEVKQESQDSVWAQKYSQLVEQFSALTAESQELKTLLSSAQQQIADLANFNKAKEVEEKIGKLNKLNLPAERKELFAEWIKEGILTAEAEAKLFSQCEAESQKFGELFKEPQGVSEEDAGKTKVEMPKYFSEVIERNKKIAEARKQPLTV
jgi:hypothetical protein